MDALRIVLDTSILVAAFRSRTGARSRLVSLILQRRIRAVCTAALFFEYEAVLKRPMQMEAHGRSRDQIEEFLLLFAGVLEKTRQDYRWRPQLRDPNDEHVLEAAISGQARSIVTFNTRDFLPAALSFGIQVVQPGVILKERFTHE